METPTNLSFWIDRVAYGVAALALLTTAVFAAVSSSFAAPAAGWARVVGERVLTLVLG